MVDWERWHVDGWQRGDRESEFLVSKVCGVNEILYWTGIGHAEGFVSAATVKAQCTHKVSYSYNSRYSNSATSTHEMIQLNSEAAVQARPTGR